MAPRSAVAASRPISSADSLRRVACCSRKAPEPAAQSPFTPLFPNVLAWLDAPVFVTGFGSAAVGASLCLLFGLGGAAGMYCGARAQKFVPARAIKVMLCLVIITTAVRYIIAYFG